MSIFEFIDSNFGFELTPCSIPANDFQEFKRDLYLLISDKLGFRIMSLFRAISPIKFLSDRPGGEVWLKHKDSGIEVQIKPIPPEASIYGDNDGIFQPMLSNNYKVCIYANGENIYFKINSMCYAQSIKHYFLKIPVLKEEYRNNRLLKIIKED